MVLPSWLSSLTGAQAFANNPANGFQPTLGDALQGIGHSMMENYRRGLVPSGSQTPGVPGGSMQQPQMAPQPTAPQAARGVQVTPGAVFAPQPQLPALDLQSVLGLFR